MRLVAPLVLLLVLGAVPPAAAECRCLWEGSFAEVQENADLVVSGKVIDTAGNSIDLEVDRELRGGQDRHEIRIWLRTGDYCRPPVKDFPVGSQWVMALNEITEDVPGGFNPHTPNISYGRIGDFELSECGGYWLSREGDWVTGNLVDAPRWAREPEMTPVLLDLVTAYVRGETDREALKKASEEDPALRELKLDTRAFLRDN